MSYLSHKQEKGMADVTSSDQVAEMVKCSSPPHTYLHREPFFIIFNMLSYLVWRRVCFNKSVTHATGRWEVWKVTIESRLLVPFASSPGISFETCVIKRLCESFWFHNLFVKFHTEKGKVRRWEKWLQQPCTCTLSSSSRMNRCVSLRVQTLFSLHLGSQNPWRFSQSSHGMVLLVKLVREKSSRRPGRKHFLPPCVQECSTPCTQEGLVLHECPEIWTNVNFSWSHCFHCCDQVACLRRWLVKQSAKQFWVEMWARSWLLPEQASFRNMEIMWIVSFLLR